MENDQMRHERFQREQEARQRARLYCKETGCIFMRQNGSSRCKYHAHKKVLKK